MAQNTIVDAPSTLNLSGFLGNSLTLRMTVLGDSAMPESVTSEARYSESEDKLKNELQPVISMVGRVITLVYPASLLFSESGWHQIKFDGRTVLAGSLRFSRSTLNRPSVSSITIQPAASTDLALTIAPCSYRAGDVRQGDRGLEYYDGTAWYELLMPGSGDGFLPYLIDTNQLFIVPDLRQSVSATRVRVDGRLRISGRLIELQ